MESTRKDEVVVDTELIEAFGEVALVDEAASFVDYNESEDNPIA
jgi:hypothetical protein